jgi:3-isopropylmalate/(R)-2-methylmalate dehydratase small subunit
LPIILDENQLDSLFKAVESTPDYKLTIDLEAQTITTPTEDVFTFSVDDFRKHCLINGLDDIGITLQYTDEITAYEQRRKQTEPWIFNK